MPYARAAMFAVLALPMTVHQFASASQDSMLIASSAVLVAIVSRALAAQRPLSPRALLVVSLIVAVNAMARPPMLAMALLLLIPGLADRHRWPRTGLAAVAAATTLAAAWMVYVATFTRYEHGHDGIPISPVAQLMRIIDQPRLFFELTAETWRIGYDNLGRHFIGELGQFEVLLPDAYYWFMAAVLGGGVLAALAERKGPRWTASGIMVAAVVSGVFGILLSLYLTWTPPGWTFIEGTQGRYLLPFALLFVAVLPALGAAAPLRSALTGFVAAAPIVTLAVVPWTVIARYYIAPN
jgi:uncharacterized membrane protein